MSRPRFSISGEPAARSRWETDHRPDRRLAVVAFIVVTPLLGVLVRLGDLHADSERLVGQPSAPVRSVLEPIPARDGRILSADGQVLAEDVERFSVLVHYRWLERPANPTWLRGEALRLLSPAERRDRMQIEQAERLILERREALWTALCEVTSLERDELFARFAAVQERVSTIHKAVQQARADAADSRPEQPRPSASTWWQWAAQSVATAVTTPPQPDRLEPLILAEELDVHLIAEGLPLAVAAAIESDPDRFPGTSVRVASRRRYPQASTAAHLIGYRFSNDRISDSAHKQPSDERTPRSVGQTGIERAYDRHLRGIEGQRRVWINRRGEPVRSTVVREPQIGRDLVLHLDLGLQTAVETRLDAAVAAVRESASPSPVPESAGGAVVVLDLRTGAVLAAASAPRFDLGRAASRDSSFWRSLPDDPAAPLFNRVCAAALPPGSVFKPVTAIALLESGKIDPDEPFDCRGYLDRKDRRRDYVFKHFGVGHGPTTLASAMAESCNVYFFHGTRIVGGQPLLTWAEAFGYGRPTGIDLPGEAAGHLEQNLRKTDALGIAIGQADLTATPLQVARMTAALANGGRLITPHVVRGSGPARHGTESVRPVLRTTRLDGLRADTLDRVREGLVRAIAHPQGTGFKTVRHPHVAIAGKTGTAEVGGNRPDHAWFAGYAPADDPQVAFVVLLEHGGSGGAVAGPVARDVVTALLKFDLLRLPD